MNRLQAKNFQSGMTLIEIMIALLIGAFLIGGILQIFINARKTYVMQDNLARLQENGRFAMDFLAQDIRMAGYWGCLKPIAVSDDVNGDNDNNVDGDSIDNGTDTLKIRGAFVKPVPPVIAIAGVNCSNVIDTTNVYYTDPTSTIEYRVNNAILEKNSDGVFRELIEGVENMQIMYGPDNNADSTPDYYVPADTPGLNMDKAVSVRIALTLRTLDDNLASSVDPVYGDRRLRRDFVSTITLRNRMP